MHTTPSKRAEVLTWLSRAIEFRPPLREQSPVWMRYGTAHSGVVVATPEFHPCCEFSIILSGTILITAEGEQRRRNAGDVFLVAPGMPHDHRVLKYPVRYITVFFLPSLLIEMSSEGDGQILFNRFFGRQPLEQRLLRLPRNLRMEIIRGFTEMEAEFERNDFGRMIRLRALLMTMLVRLRRWEQQTKRDIGRIVPSAHWFRLYRALNYLREHFAEPIYAHDLARATGVSESRLRAMFHEMMGSTWGHYLDLYRVERASVMLCESNLSVTEISHTVGFETLSLFNTCFRKVMNCSPTAYRERYRPEAVSLPTEAG